MYCKKIKDISEYTAALNEAGLLTAEPGLKGSSVLHLSCDSRDVKPGTLFICKGAGFKEEYLKKAKELGAFCCVAESDYSDVLPCIAVNDVRRSMAVLASLYNCNAWSSFPLVGMTGTKGKTTTLYYIKAAAERFFRRTAKGPFCYLSTIDTFDGKEFFESHLTTPEPLELGLRFENAAAAGAAALVMEVSSQALKYDRTYGVRFDIGAFLNFGPDHIGDTEHPDVEDYFNSKLKLFEQCKTAIVNIDSERSEDILKAAERCERLVSYSPSGNTKADYRAENIRKENGMTAFGIYRGNELYANIKLGMPGLFNADNALAAAVICAELGIPAEDLEAALPGARAAGRMEYFFNKQRDLTVLVDYAHNELSYQKLFESVKEEFPGKRVEILFGCPGGKGLSRRESLPRISAAYADYCWITEEDPALEDVMDISREVYSNLIKYGGKGEIIADREEAITKAMSSAPPGTVLILAAKGRELYQHRGYEYVEIKSDAALAEELIDK